MARAVSSVFYTAEANDIANVLLEHYVRGPAWGQNIQDRPLLGMLESNKKPFTAGIEYISTAVRGSWISDDASKLQGYSHDEVLSMETSEDVLRCRYKWYELHLGLVITWTELKQGGIVVNDNNSIARHSDESVAVLTDVLNERYEDYAESWQRLKNAMFWNDGSADSEHIPGVLSILQDTNSANTIGNLSQATYSWWRHRLKVGASKISASVTDQTLTKTMRNEQRQLRRYRGAPRRALCGDEFIQALQDEVHEKGSYTDSGFEGARDINMGDLRIGRVVFEYDPTLDDMGRSKFCYMFDPRRLIARPMGEDDKLSMPERPYNYAVLLKSMFYSGALECFQMNAQGVYEVA